MAAAAGGAQPRSSADLRKQFAKTERQFRRFAAEALTTEDRRLLENGELVPIGVVTPSPDMKHCQEIFVRQLRSRRRSKTLEKLATSLLGEAAKFAMTDVMKALLDVGADPNGPYDNSAPLWEAIRSGSVEGVRLLTSAGAGAAQFRVDPLSGTRTPLIVLAADMPASVRTTPDVIRALLDHGAPIDSATQGGPGDGETALFRAARSGNAPLTALLLEKGANPNLRLPDTGGTPLMSGADYPEIARMLLDRGADLQATDNYGRSATIFAAMGGCPEAVAFLREHGGRTDVPDKDGKTAEAYLTEFPSDGVPTGICGRRHR